MGDKMKKCIKIVSILILICSLSCYVSAVDNNEKFGATYEGYKEKYYKNGKWNFDTYLEDMKEEDFENIKKILRSEQASIETTRTDDKATKAYNEIINNMNIAYENKGHKPKTSSGKEATVSINDSKEKKKEYTVEQIKEYRELYGITEETTDQELREIWANKLKSTGSPGDALAGEDILGNDSDDTLYQNPDTTDTPKTSVGTIKDMMTDADKFMSESDAEHTNPLGENKKSLKSFSQTLSGILLTVGIVIAVIIGGILGIKFMTGAAEEKADVKQLLIPYIVGCIVVFGAITIWSIVVNFGQQFDSKKVEEGHVDYLQDICYKTIEES